MRVLFVNSNQYKLPVPAMPYGLCCVAAAVEDAGYDVHLLDLCFSKNCPQDLAEAINTFRPDIIGVSIRNIDTVCRYKTLFHLDEVKKNVMGPIKDMFSGPIVIGGPSVGINGPEMLSFFDLEFAVRGDGEMAMAEFIKRNERNLGLQDMGGLIWRQGDRIVVDNPPWRITDLDKLPMSEYYRYIDIGRYRRFKAPILIQTKRGCALNCIYCTYNIIEGKEIRLRDPQRIADEIENTYQKTGINHFEFTDSAFNYPLDHAKSVLQAIVKKKLDLNLQIMGLNPGAVDEELVELMKQVNFKEVQVGAESGSDSMLKSLGKNFTKKDIFRTGELLHQAGIPVMWYLMSGAPGETEETLKETYETISHASAKWDLVVIVNAIRIFKGSPLAKQVEQKDARANGDNFLRPVFYNPPGISLDSIRTFNKLLAFKHPNFLFPDEVQRVPFWALKIQTACMKLFAPHQPWWKFNILINVLQKILGITFLKSLVFKSKNRNLRATG